MSDHKSHNVIPTLAQAFAAFNKSADKLSMAYRQMVVQDTEKMALSRGPLSVPLLLGALEFVPNGIVVVDQEARTVVSNIVARQLTGLSGDEITRELCGDIFEETLRIKEPGRCLKRIPSGTEVEIYAMPIANDDGRVVGALGIITDLAGREGQNAPVRDLTPVLAAIGDIIMNIAHRMRSPLNAIQLFAELLKQDLGEDKQEMIDDILVGVHSLDAVLSNLLSFSQPVNPRFQEVDLAAILNESLLFATPAIKQQDISLIREYSHNELCCCGDLEQLKQVCFNLILNAIQAMPESGRLSIRASYIYKGNSGKWVDVEIHDNGCGIADEYKDRVFTPFYTTKEDGTGLGLCIVYRVIEAHHGSIQISSVEGRGTSVSLQLPVEQRV